MKKKCKKCYGVMYTIEKIESCVNCEHNGFFDSDDNTDGYQFGKIPADDIERTMVEDEGECLLGSASGEGCYLFTCKRCGYQSNVALWVG